MTKQAMYGVNLGGWLVVEKWMTPSLYKDQDATNEYELSQLPEGRRRLESHHASFIEEGDLRWLKEQGVQIVRVPFGHWIFGDRPPYIGAIERLDWLVRTAARVGLLVLLDLHGAPGAQNSYEHSGSGNRSHDKRWLDNTEAQTDTIDVLVRIAQRYKAADNVWGIQILNEPHPGLFGLKLARFYRRAYRAVTEVARPGTHIVFSDGYAPLLLTNALGLIRKKNYPAVMDIHFYQCFTASDKRRSFDGQLRKTKRNGALLVFLQLFQPMIVGEWSATLPYSVGKKETRLYREAQENNYSKSLAIFYWNYKTEQLGRWNFRNSIVASEARTNR